MLFVILVVLLVTLLYWFGTRNYDYWKNLGIPYMKPMPFFGNNGQEFLRIRTITDGALKRYNSYPHESVTGVYLFHRPSLLIRDPDLIKQVTVKSFEHFTDHTALIIRQDVDPVFSQNLFSLQGKKWRDFRTTLSPAFTSSKMKKMFELIRECGEQMTNHFLTMCKERDGKQLVLEMKGMFTHFTNDVIATAAFGINVDTFKDPNHEFYSQGQYLTNLKISRIIPVIIVPKLMKLIGQGLIEKKTLHYFQNLIEVNLTTREKHNIVRPDIIHLLMEARKGTLEEENTNEAQDTGFATATEYNVETDKKSKIQLNNDDIVAQALIFFFAGFETSSVLLSFAAYELTVNEHAQRKLQREIDETMEKCNGKVTYDLLFQMKYLDMVLTETLRMWPPVPELDRLCTKQFKLETKERDIIIEKGIMINIPAYGIHHDPQYYPNPEKFEPERFSDENKGNINPYTYLPFGIGPRSCIGSRFALMEAKVAIFSLLSKFNFEVSEKLDVPIKTLKNPFKLTAKNGFWITLKPRV